MQIFQITMRHRDQPPNGRKAQPYQYKAQHKNHQRPTPLRINQCGENVLQESYSSTRYSFLYHIAFAVRDKEIIIKSVIKNGEKVK